MSVHAGCLPDEALVNALLDLAAGRPARELQDHRAACAECNARATAWEATLNLLSADPLSVAPPAPAGLHESIMEAVRRSPAMDLEDVQEAGKRSGSLIGRLRSFLLRPAAHAWAGVAAAVGVVVVSIVGLNGPLRPGTKATAPATGGSSAWDLASVVDSTDDTLLDLSFTSDADVEVALDEASSLTTEQADWVIQELGRRLGG